MTNTITTTVTPLVQPDAGHATFLVVVQWEWARDTYLVTAGAGAGPTELLDIIKTHIPRDEGASVVSATVIL